MKIEHKKWKSVIKRREAFYFRYLRSVVRVINALCFTTQMLFWKFKFGFNEFWPGHHNKQDKCIRIFIYVFAAFKPFYCKHQLSATLHLNLR